MNSEDMVGLFIYVAVTCCGSIARLMLAPFPPRGSRGRCDVHCPVRKSQTLTLPSRDNEPGEGGGRWARTGVEGRQSDGLKAEGLFLCDILLLLAPSQGKWQAMQVVMAKNP